MSSSGLPSWFWTAVLIIVVIIIIILLLKLVFAVFMIAPFALEADSTYFTYPLLEYLR